MLVLYELSYSKSTVTDEEFLEKFDNNSIVKHFKKTYPEHNSGWGRSIEMQFPSWKYVSANDQIIAELRVHELFGQIELEYVCGDILEERLFVKIKNPSLDEIDHNHCWNSTNK